jgi:tRNA(Ile)-lysidine synthase
MAPVRGGCYIGAMAKHVALADPDARVARFARDVVALTGGGANERFGLAVSGGADSVAMLLLAQAAFPARIAAATVDHRLRAESGAEARFVSEICVARGIPHSVIALDPLARGNVSDAARVARYDALDDWAARARLDWLLTAHHADDQMETMVMRLNRASGVGGLAGVRARRGRIIRPLLGWRRSELAAVVADAGITPVDDPSNVDDRYDRARLRKALAKNDFLDASAVAASAAALADADAALDWMTLRLRRERLKQSASFWFYDAHDLPHELKRRALIDCLRVIAPDLRPRGGAIERVLAALTARKTAMIGSIRCDPVRDGMAWAFSFAPPRRAK